MAKSNTWTKEANRGRGGSGNMQQSKGEVTKRKDDVMSIEARAINVGEFAKARSAEINTLMKKVNVFKGGTGRRRSHQQLPRHMRRRASSHNVKRLPRRLRDQFAQEKDKVEAPQKDEAKARPKRSRRHRRRHSNLRQEFERRQRQHAWLETHLWHAKRFKMADLWGMRIPVQPSDKSARATYRAVAKHCLIQDISYHGVIEVKGPQDSVLEALSHLTSQQTGLTFGSKVYISGSHHGELTLYRKDKYPHSALCPVDFLWRALPSEEQEKQESRVERQLWIWVHPACCDTVLTEITDVCRQDTGIRVHGLKDELVRFRLRGPLSHPILLDALQAADVVSMPTDSSSSTSDETWWEKFYSKAENTESHKEQQSTWQKLQAVQSSSELNPRCVMALTVRDPRILIPQKRTKVMVDPAKVKVPPSSSTSSSAFNSLSPLWDADVCEAVKTTQVVQHQLNQERAKLLVPGTEPNLGRQESRIPVLLLHNPGVKGQGSRQGIMGYGTGWDVVLPGGWAMGFWIALIYRGARAGGVRESRSCSLQQGLPHFPEDSIDTEAGKAQAEMQRKEMERIQGRKPPAKRPNYAKLGIPSPFNLEWVKLVDDWRKEIENKQTNEHSNADSSVVVVRDHVKLQSLNAVMNHADRMAKNVKGRKELMERYKAEVVAVSGKGKSRKRCASGSEMELTSLKKLKTGDAEDVGSKELKPETDSLEQAAPSRSDTSSEDTDPLASVGLADPYMYVCVQLSLINKGAPGPNSIICLPSAADLTQLENNPHYGGPMEPVHKEYVLPRKPKKNNTKSADDEKTDETKGKIITDKLGVPNLEDVNLVKFCARKVIGYLTNGVHALSTGKGYGVGYCCVLGLRELVRGKLKDRPAVVLVRDTKSLQYRFASINVQFVASGKGKSRKRCASGSEMELTPWKKLKTDDAEDVGSKELKPETDSLEQAAPSRSDTSSEDTDPLASVGLADPYMYVCVQLSLINKGAPGPNSVICLPSAVDLTQLENNPHYGGPMEPVHKEYVLPRKPKKNNTKSADDEKTDETKGKVTTDKIGVLNLEDINLVKFCARKVIGYLTNGVHALSTGKGYGVGYCCVLGLRELVRGKLKDRPAVVLVRDTKSLQYRFASINVQV
ncbi:ribonucleases P/MRP protein subunit POP1-like [Amphiura filiformis]|uniref:ribonucleases P/MRP protein subunit POP1-like n=1 Tax=Amphiura filiformis TaxID=82378 RepID=UPI003B22278D